MHSYGDSKEIRLEDMKFHTNTSERQALLSRIGWLVDCDQPVFDHLMLLFKTVH